MIDSLIDRIQLLLAQGRWELAEQESRKLISEFPNEGIGFTFLALSMRADRDRLVEATEHAQQGVSLEPHGPFAHYVLSLTLENRGRIKEAMVEVDRAIELDPVNEVYFGQQGSLWASLQKWQNALESAEKGLEFDPEDETCLNIRSISLERLGRGEEAVEAAKETLKNAPDSSYSHAALGWTLLNKGQYSEAQQSFRESLRLDPNNEMARSGMITALQGNSFLFRLMHKYQVFMSRLGKYQYGLIFGAWILIQSFSYLCRFYPALAEIKIFVIMAYMIFAVATWTTEPVFNALLRFHPMGRHLLNREELIESNFVVTCLSAACFSLCYSMVFASFWIGVLLLYYWILMCVPATLPFKMNAPKWKMISGVVGVGIGLVPPLGFAYAVSIGNLDVGARYFVYFAWAIIIYQIVGSIISSKEEVV